MKKFNNTEAINQTEFKENIQTDYTKMNANIMQVVQRGLMGCKESQKAYDVYLEQKNKLLRG